MLAGAKQVAWSMAVVMAGLLAVIVANSVWIALFRLEVYILFNPWEGSFHGDLWLYMVSYMTGHTEGFIVLTAMLVLVGRLIRGARHSGERNA